MFAHNDLFVDGVGPKQVIAQMVRASEWQTFYENSGPAILPSGEPVARLTLGLEYKMPWPARRWRRARVSARPGKSVTVAGKVLPSFHHGKLTWATSASVTRAAYRLARAGR